MNTKTHEPVKIEGRNRYADEALTRIVIRRIGYGPGSEVMVIEGGYIETSLSEFTVSAKHPSADDEEGDSAYAVCLEGGGLQWQHMMGTTQTFNGAIFSARHWEPGTDEAYIKNNGYLRFIPPVALWEPGMYEIRVEVPRESKEDPS